MCRVWKSRCSTREVGDGGNKEHEVPTMCEGKGEKKSSAIWKGEGAASRGRRRESAKVHSMASK